MQFQVSGREIAAAIMGFNYCDDLEAYLRGVRGLRTFLDTLSVISINGRLGVHPGKTVLSFEAIEDEVVEVDFEVTLWRRDAEDIEHCVILRDDIDHKTGEPWPEHHLLAKSCGFQSVVGLGNRRAQSELNRHRIGAQLNKVQRMRASKMET